MSVWVTRLRVRARVIQSFIYTFLYMQKCKLMSVLCVWARVLTDILAVAGRGTIWKNYIKKKLDLRLTYDPLSSRVFLFLCFSNERDNDRKVIFRALRIVRKLNSAGFGHLLYFCAKCSLRREWSVEENQGEGNIWIVVFQTIVDMSLWLKVGKRLCNITL